MEQKIKIISMILVAAISFCGCAEKKGENNSNISENEMTDATSDKSNVSNEITTEPLTSTVISSVSNMLNETERTTTTTSESSISSSVVNTEENIPESAEKSDIAEQVAINIMTADGNIHELNYNSSNDVSVNRPSVMKGSEVFIGWEDDEVLSQISNNSVNNDETITLNIESENISDTENAIFNDTIYTRSDSEYVDIPITIGGNTNFSVLDLEISFDTELFSFDSFVNTDGDALGNYIGDGKIAVSFVSTSNIKGNVDLCTIELKKLNSQPVETNLNYDVKDIAKWNDDLTDYINVTYTIVNDKIVIY